jgi:3-hydroxyisobutyrate dehydrogenase-like beta-hydroxyacid dehydrogenase
VRIGFIGLGKMGNLMCRRLADAGHELVLYDINQPALDRGIAAFGAQGASSAADLAARVDAIMISAPGDPEVEEILFGSAGIVAGARPGLLVLDASTVGLAYARSAAERAARSGVDYLDTPVSIVRYSEDSAPMTFMVGGSEAAFERARPILECVGAKVWLVGPTGSGTSTKHVNQIIYFTYLKAFAEAVTLGERVGLPLDRLLEVLSTTSAGIPNIIERYANLADRSPRVSNDVVLHVFEAAEESLGHNATGLAPVCEATARALREAVHIGLGADDLMGGRRRLAEALETRGTSAG